MTDNKRSEREMLEWLCWYFATNGERFYPPRESAEEFVDALNKDTVDEDMSVVEAREYGIHGRAWTTAVEVFEQLDSAGYDPVQMAETEVERMRERHGSFPDLDWEWLEATDYEMPDD